MKNLLMFILLALFATPAFADEILIVDGPITVYTGDILKSGKAVEKVSKGGIITCANSTCHNRMGRGTFTMSGGATKLLVTGRSDGGYDPANGFTYQVLDGTPRVAPPPVVTGIAAHVSNPFGVNLAGCYVSDGLCPNQDDIDWYTAPAQGFELVRVAYKDQTSKAALYKTVDGLIAKNVTVVFDRHGFTWDTPANQIAFLSDRAAPYKTNTRVIIDIMNEPRNFNDPVITNDFMQWATDTKAIIAGLRAAGFVNTIAVEWPGSSGAQRFDKNEGTKDCASAACAVDRIGGFGDANVLFESHYYWDHGGAGVNPNCDPYLVIDTARAAAEKRGWKLLLGEAAAGSHIGVRDSCKTVFAQAITEIKTHPDTWFGVTWWGGGREWKESYIFKIEPTKGTRAQVPHSAYLDQLRGVTP